MSRFVDENFTGAFVTDKIDPFFGDDLLHICAHFRIEGVFEQARSHQGDLLARVAQLIGHFDADKSGTHDHNSLHVRHFGVHMPDIVGIFGDEEDPLGVVVGNGFWNFWDRSGGDDQFVVAVAVAAFAGDCFGVVIDVDRLFVEQFGAHLRRHGAARDHVVFDRFEHRAEDVGDTAGYQRIFCLF